MILIYLCVLKLTELESKANFYLLHLDNWLKANELHLNIDKTCIFPKQNFCANSNHKVQWYENQMCEGVYSNLGPICFITLEW